MIVIYYTLKFFNIFAVIPYLINTSLLKTYVYNFCNFTNACLCSNNYSTLLYNLSYSFVHLNFYLFPVEIFFLVF